MKLLLAIFNCQVSYFISFKRYAISKAICATQKVIDCSLPLKNMDICFFDWMYKIKRCIV